MSPAEAQIAVIGNLAHDLSVQSGNTVTGSIEVRNETAEIQEFRAYLRDYSFQAGGTNIYGAPGAMPRSNAEWTVFSPEAAVIPAHESIEVGYRIDVPADVAPGSYWSILMVEAVDETSSESSLPDAGNPQPQVGFRQVTRFGVQLATHVGTGDVMVSLDGIRLVTDDSGRLLFQIDVENTGTTMVRPDVYMRMFDDEGNEFGPFDGTQFRIYPGTSVRQSIPLENVPAGTYTALFVVDAGGDNVYGGQYSLTL